MLQSHLFTKALRENPAGEVAVNAQLLERAGFVYKNSAGVYTYLPLGWRVLQNIARIIREEINAIGALKSNITEEQNILREIFSFLHQHEVLEGLQEKGIFRI